MTVLGKENIYIYIYFLMFNDYLLLALNQSEHFVSLLFIVLNKLDMLLSEWNNFDCEMIPKL